MIEPRATSDTREPGLGYSRGVRRAGRSVIASFVLAVGCGGPPPVPPTAVIDATPGDVCAGDGFATAIQLSGARSAARLSLVPAPPGPDDPPLTFEWRLEGDAHHVVSGALDDDTVAVRMAGERPLHVTLTVTTFEGGVAETLRTIGVTVPFVSCEDECADGTSCVELRGERLCLPDQECASDDECPRCSVCDPDLGRCAPPEAQ